MYITTTVLNDHASAQDYDSARLQIGDNSGDFAYFCNRRHGKRFQPTRLLAEALTVAPQASDFAANELSAIICFSVLVCPSGGNPTSQRTHLPRRVYINPNRR